MTDKIRGLLKELAMWESFEKVVSFGFIQLSDNTRLQLQQILLTLKSELETRVMIEKETTSAEQKTSYRKKAAEKALKIKELLRGDELAKALLDFNLLVDG